MSSLCTNVPVHSMHIRDQSHAEWDHYTQLTLCSRCSMWKWLSVLCVCVCVCQKWKSGIAVLSATSASWGNNGSEHDTEKLNFWNIATHHWHMCTYILWNIILNLFIGLCTSCLCMYSNPTHPSIPTPPTPLSLPLPLMFACSRLSPVRVQLQIADIQME